MSKVYYIPIIQTVSGYINVEANSIEEAIKIAQESKHLDIVVNDSDIELLIDEIGE